MGQFSFEQKIEIASKMALDYCEENGLKFKQYNQKFAELIIRECIRVIDNSTPVYSSEDLQEDYCQGNLNGHQSALLEIKQHFGVEE